MKKKIFLILLFLLPASLYAQNYSLDLQVDPAITQLDLGALILANDLRGAPRIFAVMINPAEGMVRLSGRISWQKSSETGFEQIITFRTKPFTARTLFNTDLGNSIGIATSNANGDLVEEIRAKGKPTGTFEIYIQLLNENGQPISGADDKETMTFENPAQTLTIISPLPRSLQNIGGVVAEWSELNGIDHYSVKANVRSDQASSLEEALESGNPLIDDADVGLMTSVELRSLLVREWIAGQEIVFQIAAHPQGGGSSDVIYSDIINFYLDDPDNPANEQITDDISQILQQLQDGLGSEILDQILSGDIQIDQIVWGDSGMPLSPDELQTLLQYLRNNPNNIIGIEE